MYYIIGGSYFRYLNFQVPLEGFSALQGISGSQRFQIHKAYGSSDHLPSAHTWYLFFYFSVYYIFNQHFFDIFEVYLIA